MLNNLPKPITSADRRRAWYSILYTLAVLGGFLLGAVLLGTPAHARGDEHGFTWYRVADVTTVAIEYRSLSSLKFRALERQWTGRNQRGTKAIAQLLRNNHTGTYRCVVAHLPQYSIDSPVMEHERKHCHGWQHNESRASRRSRS